MRILPVAFSIAISSVVGSKLVVRIGNKAVVAGGLRVARGQLPVDRSVRLPWSNMT